MLNRGVIGSGGHFLSSLLWGMWTLRSRVGGWGFGL